MLGSDHNFVDLQVFFKRHESALHTTTMECTVPSGLSRMACPVWPVPSGLSIAIYTQIASFWGYSPPSGNVRTIIIRLIISDNLSVISDCLEKEYHV